MATAATTASPPDNNARSAWFMLLAALGYSFIPLAIMLSGSSDSPFLFGAGWRGGITVAYVLFLAMRFHKLFFNRDVWKLTGSRMFSFNILLVMIAYFDVVLLAMSIRHIDVAVATMMMEISPLFSLVVLWVSHRDVEGRRTTGGIRPATVFFMLVGLTGITFVVLSQEGSEGFLTGSASSLLYLGLLLAGASAVISTLNSFSLKWGARLTADLPESLVASTGYSTRSVNLFTTTAAGLIAGVAVVPIQLLAGLNSGESMSPNVFLLVVAGAAVTHPIAGVAWRRALLTAHDLSINAIDHVRPILSLFWLLLFSFVVVQADYLIIGTAALITANLLIGFEAEIRWGFKALILSLGACGTFIYFRGGIYTFLGVGETEWAIPYYFNWIALSATIFTLLLAFRVASLVSRTGNEEAHAFSVFRKLDLLADQGIVDNGVREHVARVDAPKNMADLKDAYVEVRSYIAQAHPTDWTAREILNDAEAELDTLVRSKQLGVILGELFALVIFAGMTIAVALLLRPEESRAFARFFIDIFAMLISAVVIFLTVNVWDMYHERSVRQVQFREDYGDYVVRFPDTERPLADLWLSVAVGVAMLVTYSGLIANRWLGWFG